MAGIAETAARAATEAAEHLMSHFGTSALVSTKKDKSMVSNLDRESENIMTGIVRGSYPHHRILGEEGGEMGGNGEYLWVLDPLDGTHNYLKGLPLFAVSAGVVRRDEFIAGAIAIPLLHRTYIAEKGSGAYRNGEPITTSGFAELASCSLAFDSGFRHFDNARYAALRAVAPIAFNARVHGCSVGNLALCADGSIDVIVEFDDYPWDYAAGVCILREAGGKVSDLAGNRFVYGGRSYIATNGVVHDEIVRRIGAAGANAAAPFQKRATG